jgi:hypothetical protein
VTRDQARKILLGLVAESGKDAPIRALQEMERCPPICGAAEAGEMLGMAATNIKRLSPPLVPVAKLKCGPIFLVTDVLAAKARRERS